MILPIHTYPDPVLRAMCARVATVDVDIQRLVIDLRDTMSAANGLGLAAPQVGVDLRVAVVGELVLINPVIESGAGEATEPEGCLSLPGLIAPISRHTQITFSATSEAGERYSLEVFGEHARAVQHEVDHLDGKLFIDYLGPVKRDLLLSRWRKR